MFTTPPGSDTHDVTDSGIDGTQPKGMPIWGWLLLALGLILVVIVAFIAAKSLSTGPKQQPPATQPTAIAEKSQPASTDPPEVAPIVLPECDTANIFAMTQLEGYGDTHEVDSGDQRGGFGPAANDALSNSVQSRGCDYPGPLSQLTAELSPEVMAKLREVVQAQGDTVESAHGIATAHTWSDRPPNDPDYDQTWAYVFIENIWIAMYLPAGEIESVIIDSAVEGVLEANPVFRQ